MSAGDIRGVIARGCITQGEVSKGYNYDAGSFLK
jgi:hypothetical protein